MFWVPGMRPPVGRYPLMLCIWQRVGEKATTRGEVIAYIYFFDSSVNAGS